jgi:hypothetical protein
MGIKYTTIYYSRFIKKNQEIKKQRNVYWGGLKGVFFRKEVL